MTIRKQFVVALSLLGLVGLPLGCAHDKPHEYGVRHPAVEDRDPEARGLEGKDVIAASDQMAQDLLALPELNESRQQWTIVVDRVDNHTERNHFDLNIFLDRLRSNLSRYGHGRVALIENRARFRDIQSREVEGGGGGGGGGDEFGQSGALHGGNAAPGPAGIQPDYGLYAKITELPNRGYSYFYCEFALSSLKTREVVWSRGYEVKTTR